MDRVIIQPADREVADALMTENTTFKPRRVAFRNDVNVFGRAYGGTSAHVLRVNCVARSVRRRDARNNPRASRVRLAG